MTEQRLETTLYSLDEHVPAPISNERRDDKRHLTLYRVGTIMIGDRRELCLIKNISAGGMMIRAYCTIEDGTALSVELKTGEAVNGKATWTKGQNVGVAFDEPIDILDILSNAEGRPQPRMPRVEIDCPITLYIDSQPLQASCVDISQGGIKLRFEGDLPIGKQDIGVGLPGLAPIRASTCWQEDDVAGVSFNTVIPLGQLVLWLKTQRSAPRKVG